MYYLVVKRHLLKRSLPVPVHLSFKKAPYYIYKKKKHNSFQLEKLIPLWSSPGKQAVGEAVRAATGAVGWTRYIKAESGALDQRLVLSHLLVGNRVVSRGNWRAITSFAFLFLGGYVQIWLWVSRSTSWKDYCDLVYINNSLKKTRRNESGIFHVLRKEKNLSSEQQLQQFEDGIPLSSFDHRRGEEVPFASFQSNSCVSIPVVEVVNQPGLCNNILFGIRVRQVWWLLQPLSTWSMRIEWRWKTPEEEISVPAGLVGVLIKLGVTSSFLQRSRWGFLVASLSYHWIGQVSDIFRYKKWIVPGNYISFYFEFYSFSTQAGRQGLKRRYHEYAPALI